jgi:hypothetical protein
MRTEGLMFPNWVEPLIALIGLVGFICFAVRQGTKVRPDKDNSENWQSYNGADSTGEGPHHGFDGHS